MEPFPRPEDLDVLSEPHPFFAKMAEQMQEKSDVPAPAPPDFSNPQMLQAVRAQRSALMDTTYGASPPSVKEFIQEIPMRDGYQSEIRIFQPASPSPKGSPLIMLSYGGGFVMGENRQLGPYARGLVQLYGAVVVCINYRLAPENPFPCGHNDVWDSFRWIGANAASLGADPSTGFIIGGVSAGANMSAVIVQNAVEQNISPPITGVWLCVPLLFPQKSMVPDEYKPFYKAREQNKDAPVLNAGAVAAFEGHLKPDAESPWYSPVNAKDAHQNLPPIYIQCDGLDPLRDDGIIYEKILRKNGNKTKLTVWPGLPHAHFAFFPGEDFSKSAVVDTFKGFAWLLGKEEPTDDTINTTVEPPRAG